jgi:UDP-2,3-diacylglucosamine pyrophosphatase LpxH
MKFITVSDLHLEFMTEEQIEILTNSLIEVSKKYHPLSLILAGDICSLAPSMRGRFERFVAACSSVFSHVIHVPGNHEYYGTSIDKASKYLDNLDKNLPKFHSLYGDGKVCEVDGIKILGSTLWFDYSVEGMNKQGLLNDFKYIEDINYFSLVYLNEKSRNLIEESGEDCPVWIFHHAPSINCLEDIYRRSSKNINDFFYSNIEDEIVKYMPNFVIHGHTHQTYRWNINDYTTILCNARGYDNGSENTNFDIEFGFEI